MDLEELGKIISDRYNRTPVKEFEGLSPNQMRLILYEPFARDCAPAFNRHISAQTLAQIPIFQLGRYLMHILDEEGGVRHTPKGNLPLRIVRLLYDRKYLGDLETWIDFSSSELRSEDAWPFLWATHRVLQMAGLVRKYRKKIVLTKKGKDLLSSPVDLFFEIFENFALRFNWGYFDGHRNKEGGQFGFLFLMFLVNRYGSTFRPVKFYADKYFRAFPMLKVDDPRFEALPNFDYNCAAVNTRFFFRFSRWFGLIECKDLEPSLPRNNTRYRKTVVLTALMQDK